MSAIRVPLAVDAEVRLPLGPFLVPLRGMVLAAAITPVALGVLQLPISVGKRLALAAFVALIAVGGSAPRREGVWLGTYWLLRVVGTRFVPSHLSRGQWGRGRVRIHAGGASTSGARPGASSTRALAALAGYPRQRRVEDGLFDVDPGGWRAVVEIDGPMVRVSSPEYGRWCDAFVAWLRSVGCPAQLVTRVERVRRAEAERAFDDTCRLDPRDGPLWVGERRFAGQLAADAVTFRHAVVFAPALVRVDGTPWGLVARRAPTSVARAEAEHILGRAVAAAAAVGIGVRAASSEEVATLLAESTAGAREAAGGPSGILVGTRHVAVFLLTRMGAELDYGYVVNAILRTKAVASLGLHVLPVRPGDVRRQLERRRAWLRYALREGRGDVDLQVALRDLESLQADIAAGHVAVTRSALTVSIQADESRACEEAAAIFHAAMASAGFQLTRVTVPGLAPAVAASPGAAPLRRATLLTTDAVVSRLLPVLGTPFSDIRRPAIGRNARTNASAYLSVFTRPNYNALFVGSSGAGKTVAAMTMFARELEQGANGIVVDNESEWGRLIRLFSGSYYELADTSINPLGIGSDASPDVAASRVVPVLSVMIGDHVEYRAGRPVRRLPDEDKAWLHRELAEFLAWWRRTSPAREPVISAFLQRLHSEALKRPTVTPAVLDRYIQLALRLEKYTQAGLGEVFDRPSSLRFEPGHPVGVGFRSMSLDYGVDLTPAQAVVLSHITEAVGRAAELLIIFIGEAHVLMNDPDAGQTLEQLARRVRKYLAALWLETQKWDDLLKTATGSTAIATAATKWIFGQEEMVSEQARAACDLDDDEVRALTPPVIGQAVVISGWERAILNVEVGDTLAPFIFPIRTGFVRGRAA